MLLLKFTRIEQGLSQREVADRANVVRSELSRFETGRANPTTKELLALACVLGTPADRLLDK
jgi:transcriptional regulator with XRE-family HTH domain